MYKYSFALILLSGLFFAGFVLSKTVFADTPQNPCQDMIDTYIQKGWRSSPAVEARCQAMRNISGCVAVLYKGSYAVNVSIKNNVCKPTFIDLSN